MKKTIATLQRHHIAFLLGSAALAILLVFKFSGESTYQFLILTVLTFLYLTWAMVFHLLDRSLKVEVMIEYILTALLALIFFYGLLI